MSGVVRNRASGHVIRDHAQQPLAMPSQLAAAVLLASVGLNPDHYEFVPDATAVEAPKEETADGTPAA